MKRLLVLSLFLLPVLCAAQGENSVAAPEAVVVQGHARFTVLTDRLIRMEWAQDGVFEDRATLGIVNRRLEVPRFTVKASRGKVVIKTASLTLTYKGDEAFNASNLQVKFPMGIWKPGMDDSGNLRGTTRTLDKFNGREEPVYDPGVISRDGWALIDESDRHVFLPVASDWGKWVACREPGERQDWYLFAYGHDYTAAISDFTKVAGRIPLSPKYAFGYWWCRYWQYSDFELVDLAKHFRDFSIPMDVMIIDMDWHETWDDIKAATPGGRDNFGERIGWTGFTWKKNLFPNPANHLRDLHDFGVRTSLNLHFNNGIQPYEEPYCRFVEDYLSRTDDYDGPKGYVNADGTPAPVPFRIDQEAWADAFFNSIMHPMEEMGVDFWWLDWQQWRESKYTEGLSNTFWLNYTFFQDKVRQTASMGPRAPRAMIYHRWGGIGSHRYQVGFSGDCYATWDVLRYLPYFTATASNVGYGYWGHDIGGHIQAPGVNATDPELYLRWIQEGVFTPIFKTHSTKNLTMEKRFWVFPDHFDAMREAIRLRYTLSPYIYTAARVAYDSGICLCRPLYYSAPEAPESYEYREEFFFGDDILATVIATPADSLTGLAPRRMWFPAGSSWYDMATGEVYAGGTVADLSYTVSENPWFVRCGAVIPIASDEITSLQQPSDEIAFLVAPGEGSFETRLYEDDGATQAYLNDYAWTRVSKQSDGAFTRVQVFPREGSYEGAPSERKVRIVLEGVFAPVSVTVDGVDVPYSRFAAREAAAGKAVWGYDGTSLSATVYLPSAPATVAREVECCFDASAPVALLRGRKALFRRAMTLTPETKLAFGMTHGGIQTPAAFLDLAECGTCITEDPFHAVDYLQSLRPDALEQMLQAYPKLPEGYKAKIRSQLKF